MILQFFVSLATARYLGPSNFGTINYVAAFVSFFSSIASLGLAVVVIKEVSLNRYDNNEIIWTSIWLRFGTAILSTISIVALMFITNRDDPMIVQIAVLNPYRLCSALLIQSIIIFKESFFLSGQASLVCLHILE